LLEDEFILAAASLADGPLGAADSPEHILVNIYKREFNARGKAPLVFGASR
jgi:hypothetical protein